MTEREEWREVVGFPGYLVSSLGRVRGKTNARGPSEVILKPGRKPRTGHLFVVLQSDGKPHHRSVHRLVAEAFEVGGIGPNVLHGDDDVENNRPENLRWGTFSDNAQDREDHGRGMSARWAKATHCKAGLHEWTDENTYVNPRGIRRCRACARATWRAWKERQTT